MGLRHNASSGQGQEASSARLRDKRFNGYLRIRLPHELDAEVEATVVVYMRGSATVRQKTSDSVDVKAAAVLSAHGQRVASTAIRAMSVEPLRLGLVAVSLSQGRLDQPHDNLFVLAALNDGATLMGTTLQTVLTGVARLLPPAGLTAIQEFDQRHDRDKSLTATGLARTGSGQTFLSTWRPPLAPGRPQAPPSPKRDPRAAARLAFREYTQRRQLRRRPEAPEAYGAVIIRAEAAPGRSRFADRSIPCTP
ncbi:hypothetical protein ACIBL8_43110 [Streptomyces sp. NPDC050523]|uniref:hypothetical protein n=1 Tax=Streptomyces sp. NPDC050523 TaxID=3365622 RepID=UPI0037B733C4